jgi:uncharacterized protein (UPF0210 family)
MRIRSITLFTDMQIPPKHNDIQKLSDFARDAKKAYEDAGFSVQTLRLATDIFPALQASAWKSELVEIIVTLECICRECGFEYIALGPASRVMLPYIDEILSETSSVFVTTHIVKPGTGNIDVPAIKGAARIIRDAAEIENGFGNLRFAALANVYPGSPFFPGAYFSGKHPYYAIATESADLAVKACRQSQDAAQTYKILVNLIREYGHRITSVAKHLAQKGGPDFTGIDFSLAPYPEPDISIGWALEELSGQKLGSAGTLSAAAILAAAIQSADFPHTGYCGLMLPVLEDVILAQRAAEKRLYVGDLLKWSAVCGTGLDTVPLPGKVSEQALVHLLFDVAALSVRLNKPLTARLMPLPGKKAGDPVHFDFPYFADGGVLKIDEGHAGKLDATETLQLLSRATGS